MVTEPVTDGEAFGVLVSLRESPTALAPISGEPQIREHPSLALRHESQHVAGLLGA
jgi:hypothetical protein